MCCYVGQKLEGGSEGGEAGLLPTALRDAGKGDLSWASPAPPSPRAGSDLVATAQFASILPGPLIPDAIS